MNIEIIDTDISLDCRALRDPDSSAFIWSKGKAKGLTFFIGNFTIEEIEEILTQMKKEAVA